MTPYPEPLKAIYYCIHKTEVCEEDQHINPVKNLDISSAMVRVMPGILKTTVILSAATIKDLQWTKKS